MEIQIKFDSIKNKAMIQQYVCGLKKQYKKV